MPRFLEVVRVLVVEMARDEEASEVTALLGCSDHKTVACVWDVFIRYFYTNTRGANCTDK